MFPAADNCVEIPEEGSVDVVIEACGIPSVLTDGVSYLRPGGLYLLVGMVHPNSQLPITGEQIIRKCLTLKGKSKNHGFWTNFKK